jgi:hypothetical protein
MRLLGHHFFGSLHPHRRMAGAKRLEPSAQPTRSALGYPDVEGVSVVQYGPCRPSKSARDPLDGQIGTHEWYAKWVIIRPVV